MSIGENIRKIRLQKNITQKQLAEILGTSQQNLAQYEAGKRNPKPETTLKIAQALGVLSSQIDPKLGETIGFDTPEDFDRAWSKIVNNARISEVKTLMNELNIKGQEKAVEQIKLLTKIPEYQKASTED